ncbi:unnamed protein product [Blepharisma stoltei]|uniref:Uncharacterized protein n=1 Tax=Blepharisma stoltei TaxID=1481888 RepID=A0AAU9IR56_9CILI|nr:unnamed protein product [Blepharisma stoltei]
MSFDAYHWAKRQQELQEHSKQLALQKINFSSKNSQEKSRYGSIKISQKDAPVEELRMMLHLGQEEIQDITSALSLERKKNYEIESQLQVYKDRCEDLERTNRSLTTLLVEKDNLVSKYVAELALFKNFKPSQGKISMISDLADSINLDEEDVSEEWTAQIIHQPVGKKIIDFSSVKQPNLLDREIIIQDEIEFKKLKRALQETQELYRATSEQLKEKSDKCDRQEEELAALRAKLQETRNDFNSLSSQILRQSSDRDYQSKSILVELDELRAKKSDYENELKKLENRYKASIEQFESDLANSRERFLSLLDSKTKIESEILESKIEKRELQNQLQVKDTAISEMSATIQSYEKEISFLKKSLSLNGKDISKIDQSTEELLSLEKLNHSLKETIKNLENKEKHHLEEIENLKEKIEIYETEQNHEAKVDENVSQQTLQQLSYIILSKDKASSLDSSSSTIIKQVFGDNCMKLIENYEEMLQNLQADKQTLRDRLNYEVEQRAHTLEEVKGLLEVMFRLDSNNREVEYKIKEVSDELFSVRNQLSDDVLVSPKHVHNVFSFRDSEEKLKRRLDQQLNETKELERLKTSLEQQKSEKHRALAEKEQYREDLAQSILIIAELKEKISMIEGTAQNCDLIGFLQCEAAAFEDIFGENQLAEESFSEL